MLVPARLDNFLIYGRAGVGSMGLVFQARDLALNRNVAIKFVSDTEATHPEARARLQHEARAASRINHPCVAQMYALNFHQEHPYIVMELVAGENFADRLSHLKELPETEVLQMALDITSGLSALEYEGLAHGDIKPGNIVRSQKGNAKLVDFGLAGTRQRHSGTRTLGTASYMAPEVMRGGADTIQSDFYSLGVTLYHLLTGRAPSESEITAEISDPKILRSTISAGPLVRRKISPVTRQIILRLLDLDPWKRPKNCQSLISMLQEAQRELNSKSAASSATKAPSPKSAARSSRSRKSLVIAASLLTIILVSALLPLVSTLKINKTNSTQSKSHSTSIRQSEWLANTGLLASLAQPDWGNATQQDLSHTDQATPPTPWASLLLPNAITLKNPEWHSIAIGGDKPSGSTMQIGNTIVLQSSGRNMFRGQEHYRFVWLPLNNNFSFTARIKNFDSRYPLDMTGIMLKGPQPEDPSSLIFGILGQGQLFLQQRTHNTAPTTLTRSNTPVDLPCWLRLEKYDHQLKALFSPDGKTWSLFGSHQLETTSAPHCVGFCLSAQQLSTLITATFADIHIMHTTTNLKPPTGG